MRRMVLAVLAVTGLVGCKDDGGGHFPVGPGGGGPGAGGGSPDASFDASDGGPVSTTRVCLVTDPRNLASCASTGAGGLTVTLGTATATTGEDGSFVIAAPATDATWHVSGGAIVPSVMPFASGHVIPAIDATTYSDMFPANGLLPTPGQASAMVRVLRGGAPQAGHIVALVPQPQYATYYDSSNATVWNQNSTGAFGTAWLPGASVGTATLSVDGASVGQVPMEADAITFVTVDTGTL